MSSTDEVYYIDADTAAPRKAGVEPKRRWGRGSADATLTRTGGRRPLAAASLSLLLCGAGQLYNNRREMALLYFLTELMVVALDWCLWRVWQPLVGFLRVFFIEPSDLILVAVAGNFLFLLFVIGNAVQAFQDAAGGEPAEGLGRPLVSAMASLAAPGWGQFLNAQPRKAATLMGLFITCLYALAVSVKFPDLWRMWDPSTQVVFDWALPAGGWAALGAAVVVYLTAFYDALLVARRQRTEVI
jgi:TM2 domain-containing membrane protein YozV